MKHPVAIDLARVIDACTFFDDRGPVYGGGHRFVDATVPVPKTEGRATPGATSPRVDDVRALLDGAGREGLSSSQLAKRLNLHRDSLWPSLNVLRELGEAEMIGTGGPGTVWRLVDEEKDLSGDPSTRRMSA